MKVRAERVGSAFLLELEGRLTIETDTQPLSEAVREVLEVDVEYLVLDLAKVSQLDCAGIGLLLRLHNRLRESNREFMLINVERRIRQLLQRAGLLAVFPVLGCWQDAVTCRERAVLPLCEQAARPFQGKPETTRRARTDLLQLAL